MKTHRKPTHPAGSQQGYDHHRLIRSKLGPVPAEALRAMEAYGLDDAEIGQYFGVTPSSIERLKRQLCPLEGAFEETALG